MAGIVTRISTFTFSNRLNSENLRIQREASNAQLQIASGKKSRNFTGISNDVQRLLNSESDLARITTQNIVAATAQSRINQMFSTMGSMLDLANNFSQTLAQNIGSLASPTDLQVIAQNSEEALASLLNVNLGGRYLFAGSQVDIPPVDLTDPLYTPQVVPSVANTGYYQGDNIAQNVTIADGYNLDYGVTADDIGFERLLRAMNLAANNPADAAAITEALQLVSLAIDDIATQRTDISSKATLIDARVQNNQDEAALLQDIISTLEDTDLAEASIRLTQYETQLEASYATTARILRLNLHDFIN